VSKQRKPPPREDWLRSLPLGMRYAIAFGVTFLAVAGTVVVLTWLVAR